MNLKKIIFDFLVKTGILHEKFIGKIIIDINQGVRSIVRKEKIM